MTTRLPDYPHKTLFHLQSYIIFNLKPIFLNILTLPELEMSQNIYDWDESYRNTIRQGTEALLKTAESLERSERVALETSEAGTAILSDLRTQTESLERAKSNLQHMNNQLSQSQKLIRTLYRRVFTNKFIVILIIILEIAILGTVVYLKFFKKH